MSVDEFGSEMGTSLPGPSAPGEGPFAGGGPADLPDMDALFEQAVDQADVQRTREDSLKPTGNYVTAPTLTVTPSRVKEGVNEGRLMIRFFGPAVLTATERTAARLKVPVGTVIKGQFGFGMSPERANKITDGMDTGEPDHPSKLWAQAVTAFEVAYKRKAGQIKDVVNYIQNYPVILRVIQVGIATDKNPEPDGEPGNIVMAISPVRET